MSCRLTPPASGPARAIAAAGWMPFNYFGQPITQDNVEIVGGVTGADGMCRPTQFNVFVFVAGRFAGTLSPALMTSRRGRILGKIDDEQSRAIAGRGVRKELAHAHRRAGQRLVNDAPDDLRRVLRPALGGLHGNLQEPSDPVI